MTATSPVTRFARAALVGAACIAATLGTSTVAHADVGTPKAKLTITDRVGFSHDVTVRGHVPMSRTEAQGLIDSGHYVAVRLWGDDPVSDDLVDIMPQTRIWASSRGLELQNQRAVTDDALDEDWGGDELFCSVVLAHSGHALRRAQTNHWYDNF